jgi:prefoldin beta subunit
MAISLPPEAQQLLIQIQTFQQEAQAVMVQKESMNLQKLDIERALEVLEESKEEDVFKAVGPILIKAKKSVVKKELKEKQESIDLRLKRLDNQQETLNKKLKEKQEELDRILREIESKKV